MLADTVRVNIPEGYVPEAMPASVRLENRFGIFVSDVTYDEALSRIVVSQTIRLNAGRYSRDMYSDYRAFAREVSKAYGARVVLVRK